MVLWAIAAANRVCAPCASACDVLASPPNHQSLHWPMMMGAGPKGPERFGASLKPKEDDMKLVTRFEAATLGTAELYSLRKEAFNAAPRGSQDQRDALLTMRNIEDELATRAPSL